MLPDGWPVWFFAGCALVALLCIAIGAIAALRAALAAKKHAKEIEPVLLIARLSLANEAVARIQGDLALIEALVARATAAVDGIAGALRELRLAFSLRR